MLSQIAAMLGFSGAQTPAGDPLEQALRNGGCKPVRHDKLPTRDFHYPDWIPDGNSEVYRMLMDERGVHDPESRQELAKLEDSLRGCTKLYVAKGDDTVTLIRAAVPRMEIDTQL